MHAGKTKKNKKQKSDRVLLHICTKGKALEIGERKGMYISGGRIIAAAHKR
jgi:hypothetical protein